MVQRQCRKFLLLFFLFLSIHLSISGDIMEFKNSKSNRIVENQYFGSFLSNFNDPEMVAQESAAFIRAGLPYHLRQGIDAGWLEELIQDILDDETIRETCRQDIGYWLTQVNKLSTGELTILTAETWVLHMLDSWGKFPSGILSGHVNSLGDWDECVELKGERAESTFRGKYCTTYLIPDVSQWTLQEDTDGMEARKAIPVDELLEQLLKPAVYFLMVPSTATCWPTTCNERDIQKVVKMAINDKQNFFNATIQQECSTIDRPDLTAGNIAMITVLCVLAALCISATVVDVVAANEKKRGVGVKVLLSFSLYTNVLKCLSTKSDAGNLGCLHGIRFFSTAWVVFGHSNLFLTYQPYIWNTVDLNRLYDHHWSHFTVLGGFYAVDTFFAMSGMLACFGLLRALKKSKGRVNIPMLYLHRYLRITPTYALLIGLIAAIFPLLGRGPWWIMRVGKTAKDCQDGWWLNLLYVQNLMSYDKWKGEEMCQAESWYIADDMQFFIIMPIFVYLIWRWRIIGFIVLAVFSVASIVAPAVVTAVEELPPSKLPWMAGGNPMVFDVYDKPWYRLGPYLAGILMGYVLYKLSGKPVKLNKWFVALGWACSTAAALGLLFGIRPYFNPHNDWSVTGSAIYAGVSRYLWGAIIMWIVFACQFGYGWWVNDFLSWKVFMPLGRLTFCVYMSSTSIQELLHYQVRYAQRYDVFSLVHTFMGHMVICFMVGFLLTVTMESPFIQLEKIAFGGMTQPKPKPEEKPAPAVEEKQADVET